MKKTAKRERESNKERKREDIWLGGANSNESTQQSMKSGTARNLLVLTAGVGETSLGKCQQGLAPDIRTPDWLRLKTEPKCCGHGTCVRCADWNECQIDGESPVVLPDTAEVLW